MLTSTDGYLPVDDHGHQVYWEVEDDNGEGKIPVLVLHGGWGPLGHDGRFLDRSRFRRVYMHQRGWGNSTPTGIKSLKAKSEFFVRQPCRQQCCLYPRGH